MRERIGTPIAKIFVNFLEPGKKYLVLDADTVFVGRVLDRLSEIETDFIVSKESNVECGTPWFKKTYYDISMVHQFDPEFEFPGYSFNSGQVVITTGKLCRDDFRKFVDFETKERLFPIDRRMFPLTDQSIYNYLLPKKEQSGEISLHALEFSIWGVRDRLSEISVSDIEKKKSRPFLVHWAGTVASLLRTSIRRDILIFFQKYYYSRIPYGALGRLSFNIQHELRFGFPYSLYRWIKAYFGVHGKK